MIISYDEIMIFPNHFIFNFNSYNDDLITLLNIVIILYTTIYIIITKYFKQNITKATLGSSLQLVYFLE